MSRVIELPTNALSRLGRADPRLRKMMRRLGPFALRCRTQPSSYAFLARSIVFQQLSGRAATTIYRRLCALHDGRRPPPPPLLISTADSALRGAGLSRQKIAALRDLAAHVERGALPLRRATHLSDEDLTAVLCQVRGVGPWTAQMFLMFQLGRLDVLPDTDLGVQKGLRVLDELDHLPTPTELRRRGEVWRPYRSVASWYLWRAVDNVDVGGW